MDDTQKYQYIYDETRYEDVGDLNNFLDSSFETAELGNHPDPVWTAKIETENDPNVLQRSRFLRVRNGSEWDVNMILFPELVANPELEDKFLVKFTNVNGVHGKPQPNLRMLIEIRLSNQRLPTHNFSIAVLGDESIAAIAKDPRSRYEFSKAVCEYLKQSEMRVNEVQSRAFQTFLGSLRLVNSEEG